MRDRMANEKRSLPWLLCVGLLVGSVWVLGAVARASARPYTSVRILAPGEWGWGSGTLLHCVCGYDSTGRSVGRSFPMYTYRRVGIIEIRHNLKPPP